MRVYNWRNSIIKYLENSKNRELILVGNDVFTLEIFDTLIYLSYKVLYVITHDADLFRERDVEIKKYEQIDFLINENTFFLVAELSGHKYIYELLTDRNLKLNKDFAIMGFGGYTTLLNAIDSLLTLNREDDIIGFRKYGSGNGKYSIVVLGNSTSDPTTGNLMCWAEYLKAKFDSNGCNVDIYNGAITGYSSTQEYLKLGRDVLQLNPDLVISFSGYNDISGNSFVEEYPYLHKYANKFYNFLLQNEKLAPDSMFVRDVKQVVHGLKDIQKDYEIWINNMRKMNAICKEFGIVFHAYLQPMSEYLAPPPDNSVKKIIEEMKNITGNFNEDIRQKEFCEGAKNILKHFEYIKDLSGIFRNHTNVYYDICHYTEHGNEIIANAVYKDIQNEVSS